MFKIPRLFVMMFMQYFVQGAWNMTIGAVLATYNMKESIGNNLFFTGTRNNYFAIIYWYDCRSLLCFTKSNFNFTHLKWLSYVATTYLYFRR